MIVSNWDPTQDLLHEAGKFTHRAITNIHFYKALFNVIESHVVTRMMIT